MRKFITFLLLLGAVSYLVKNHGRMLEKLRLPESAPPAARGASANEDRAEALTAVDYERLGLPSLDVGWDAVALKKLTDALTDLASDRPRALPNADSDYGKAFFSKLSYTANRFPLLSPDNKLETYNAFLPLIPIYSKAHNKEGPRRDLELALLIGLEFKLIVGCTEDPLFVKSRTDVNTRIHVDLDRNIIASRPASIFFRDPRWVAHGIKERLGMLADSTVFRSEARVLGLSHISMHLPTIALRLDLKNMRSVLTALRARETHAQARAYYDIMLQRVP